MILGGLAAQRRAPRRKVVPSTSDGELDCLHGGLQITSNQFPRKDSANGDEKQWGGSGDRCYPPWCHSWSWHS